MKSPTDPSQTPPRQRHDDGTAGAVPEVSAGYIPLTSHMIGPDSLAALASQMSDGVCLLTADGHIGYANPALRALLGRSEFELLGKRIDEFRLPVTPPSGNDARNADNASHASWAPGERISVCQLRRSDGAVFEARCSQESLAAGSAPGGSILLLTPLPRPVAVPRDLQVSEAERIATRRWLEVIAAITDATLMSLPANDLIEAMLNRIRPALALENVGVFLVNKEGDALDMVAGAGTGREFASAVHIPLDASALHGAMTTHEPIVVNEAAAFLRKSGLFPEPLLASMTIRSMLLMPLIFEDQVIGLLTLGAGDLNHFTVEDIRLARVAGARVALAVAGARAREAEARAREEAAMARRRLVLLAEASEALVGPLDHKEIATRLVTLVSPAFASACALYLVEDDGAIRRIATSGLEDVVGDVSAPGHAAVARALERLPLEIESFDPLHMIERVSADAAREEDGSAGNESVKITRISVEAHGHPLGSLYLIDGTQRQLAPEDQTLLQGLTGRAAVGMEIARLYAELEQALLRVSESAIQLDSIFESTDAGIYVTDASGQFLRINTYGARMLGIREPFVLGAWSQPHAASELRDEHGNYIPPEEAPIHIARTQNITVERRVIIHRFDSGVDIPAIARCAPMSDARGRVIGAVGVLMDITGINEIERQKDEFLGIVSHELKTPLTTLKILSQMLARRMRASNEQRSQEQAERMTTAIVRMERLINDLLDVSRIQEGKLTLTLTVCDLGAICRDVVSEQEITNQRPIHLNLPDRESLTVHADIERLRQVIVNLLSNALKYSPPNTPVSLRVREASGQYLVSVEDHGPGLPADERRRLFHRFYRAPGVQVQSGSGVGLGLGLFISREIVRNHGGDIWVESEVGHGSVFTFSIPRASHEDTEVTTDESEDAERV